MVQMIVDRRQKGATNLDKNVLPIELAVRHILNHGYISEYTTLMVRGRNGKVLGL
jgi:hypothetical protein